jgi:DNA-binding transcriptional regulator LsrR (DeoR family)
MAKAEPRADETVTLLKHLVAIELWRGGLTQAEIKSRLGLGSDVVSGMLKGVSREVIVRTKGSDG